MPVSDMTKLHIVLVEPEIPPNTGNVARLCAAAELCLHLVHPLGFSVDDRHLKRAGLDYWHLVDVVHHHSLSRFLAACGDENLLAFSRRADTVYTEAPFSEGDYLLFGRETAGLPGEIMSLCPSYRIPMTGKVRSLNLATSVGIVAYEALRQINGW
jgi:tRNA (cytidine/uridine-2'-O-)-methyltransferase